MPLARTGVSSLRFARIFSGKLFHSHEFDVNIMPFRYYSGKMQRLYLTNLQVMDIMALRHFMAQQNEFRKMTYGY